MATNPPVFGKPPADPPIWFLKVDESQIRGPVTLATLRQWAEEGTLNAGDQISSDARTWQPAATVAALEMDWVADLGGGHSYGPFNIVATRLLVERGILMPDSVLRRSPMHHPSATPSTAPTESTSSAATAVGSRVGQLEGEVHALRRELSELHGMRDGGFSISGRSLTDTRPHSAEPRPLPIHVEPRQTGFSVARRPPLQIVEEDYVLERPEDVREMARTRRFRVQTLRWNIINSSLVIGTGVTVGAIGVILEVEPVHYTGVVLSFLGLAYFGLAMLLLLCRKVATWANLSVVRDATAPEEGHPLRGALNITFVWFNRKFRSRDPQP